MQSDICQFGGKKIYRSRSHAQQTIKALRKHRRAKRLRAYECPHCHHYHLTSHNHKVR